MKKITSIIVFSLIFACLFTTGCSKKIESIYHTPAEWNSRYNTPVEDNVNQEITDGKYDKKLDVKCINGTFVGRKNDGVVSWKGIPFAQQPMGELRFKQAQEPLASDKIYQAYYFGSTTLQPYDPMERASVYHQGEDSLTLAIYKNEANKNKNSPVLVYIHGGGWVQGGMSDSLYDGWNFVHYNPDVILVTITYRVGLLGQINFDCDALFEDADEFKTSTNNGLLDQVAALKWVKKNIAAFGGNPDNVTISGESAGGGAVSSLCLVKEAKGLFNKVIAMSGGINQYVSLEASKKLAKVMAEDFNCKTVKDLQKIDFKTLSEWWEENKLLLNFCIRDGNIVPEDPWTAWKETVGPDISIMQGATTNEFAYYRLVFGSDTLFEKLCEAIAYVLSHGEDKAGGSYDNYINTLKAMGFTDEREIFNQIGNDYSLQMINYYQAHAHAANGGKEFIYAFDQSFDSDTEVLRAAHAIDCHYLFGNFDGKDALGTSDEVEFSRKFQKMVSNFCKNGNPSIENLEWNQYDPNNGLCMELSAKNCQMTDKYQARINSYINLMENVEMARYIQSWDYLFGIVATLPGGLEALGRK